MTLWASHQAEFFHPFYSAFLAVSSLVGGNGASSPAFKFLPEFLPWFMQTVTCRQKSDKSFPPLSCFWPVFHHHNNGKQSRTHIFLNLHTNRRVTCAIILLNLSSAYFLKFNILYAKSRGPAPAPAWFSVCIPVRPSFWKKQNCSWNCDCKTNDLVTVALSG